MVTYPTRVCAVPLAQVMSNNSQPGPVLIGGVLASTANQ